MRIVHLITHLRLGAGRAVVDLAIRQARDGRHEVVVAMADDAEGTWQSDPALVRELEAAGVATATTGDFFHRQPAAIAESARQLGALLALSRARTVVHAHTAIGAAVARWAGADQIVVTCHGWSLDRPADHTLQDTLAFSLADVIVSPSTYWAERVSALPGSLPVHVVPYGFDLTSYPMLGVQERPVESLRIVCVGEMTRRKGQDLLIEAMPAVWRDAPAAELHFFGDGDLAPILRDRATVLDPMKQRIVFHGHVSQPYPELAGYDVFCLPTRSDNQPVSIVEAMLAGLPIVTTTVGGIPEMIVGSASGEIVPAESADALGDSILRLGQRTDRRELGARGRTFARRTYNVDTAADRLEALYDGGAR